MKRGLICIVVVVAAAGGLLIYRLATLGPNEPASSEQVTGLATFPTPSPDVTPSPSPTTPEQPAPTPPKTTAISWELIQESTGDYGQDRVFPESLEAFDQKTVSLVGFVVPLEDYSNAHSFMLLPYPTSCYYCAAPAPNELLYVELTEATNINFDAFEPMEIRGVLALWHEPEEEFLFGILDAAVRAAEE